MQYNYSFPEITLLITHYNRSSSLNRLLQSFEDLSCRFGEIVVSDDGSKQEHIEKIKELQKSFQFRLITTPQNKGLGNNINKGQDAVTKKFTLYVQEDFLPAAIFPEKLQYSFAYLQEDKTIDIARFYAYFKYPYLKAIENGFSIMKFKLWYPGYRKFYFYSDHPHLRRSSFFEKFGRYPEGLGGDKTEYLMMINFLKQKGKGIYYDNFNDLFDQKNSTSEPSTVKRGTLKESNNIIISNIRHLYRHVKFNSDYLFLSKRP